MSGNYQELFNRDNLELSENEAIDLIIDWRDKSKKLDLRHLTHFVTPDLELEEYFEIKGLYIATNILRQEYDFEKDSKPGDFDVVVIPFSDSNIHFERTGVLEVKIVRPTRKKPLKNSNSLGVTQLKGLINDGFPFVGLMHLSLTEPLNDNEKGIIDFCTLPVGDNVKFEKGKKFEDYLVKIKFDGFQGFSVEKQIQRLISNDIPKYAALICLGITQKPDKSIWLETVSRKYSCFETGYFNPHAKKETIQKVKNHFLVNQSKYIKKSFK
ncbi:hypothetical protein M0G43_07800 [Subsaxibacter sp. CAU 1640]|uniref:hypothetical protein n=1 Tax=Subsaxibacter sp. CAU 1640 TaxID=2933271 RepID=UPI002004A9FD|nr:hypothetical protein [Subsaxibacter sp. CAU 1640]MCK7590470.1 hypothetical protein [Subsaxibacter sp. CAU 1640]